MLCHVAVKRIRASLLMYAALLLRTAGVCLAAVIHYRAVDYYCFRFRALSLDKRCALRCAVNVADAVVSAQLFVVSCGRSVAECKYVVLISQKVSAGRFVHLSSNSWLASVTTCVCDVVIR